MRPYHIVAAVDGSDEADRAVDWAAQLARCNDVPLTIIHVLGRSGAEHVPMSVEEHEYLERIDAGAQGLLRSAADKLVGRAARRAVEVGAPEVDTVILTGDPAVTIATAAEDLGANLVVMGSRGLSNVPGMMLGSVSHRMLHTMDRGAVLAVH